MCKVVNLYKEPFTVYIGRDPVNTDTKWGNPFVMNIDGDREEVIEKFRKYLWKQIKKGNITIAELVELDGEVLGCFCKPQACHGDVIVKAVEWAKKQ